MNRSDIISNLFTGKNFNECLNKMEPDHLREDLRQEVILIICEMPADKLIGLWQRKQLEFYTVKVILNQIKSTTSPFAKKYRQYTSSLIDNYGAEETIHFHNPIDIEERELRELIEDMAVEEIDRLYWYNKGLIELYVKHSNYRAIEKETGIPWESCYKTIRKSFQDIKQKVSK